MLGGGGGEQPRRLPHPRRQGVRATAASEGLLDALSSLTYSGTSDLQKVIIAASLGLQP